MERTECKLLRAALPTPHWGVQGGSAFTIRAVTTDIHASAPQVAETLLNISAYPCWNHFVPRISEASNRLQPGDKFTEHVDMFGNGRPSGIIRMKLSMTMQETTHETNGIMIVWLGRLPSWLLRSERVHEIVQGQDHGASTTYTCYETFSGPLAGATRLFVGRALVSRFAQWNAECVAWTESAA